MVELPGVGPKAGVVGVPGVVGSSLDGRAMRAWSESSNSSSNCWNLRGGMRTGSVTGMRARRRVQDARRGGPAGLPQKGEKGAKRVSVKLIEGNITNGQEGP